MHDAATAMTRRSFAISRLLPALAVTFPCGTRWLRSAGAEVNSGAATTSIQQRINRFRGNRKHRRGPAVAWTPSAFV